MDEKQFTQKFLEMTPTYGTMIGATKGVWTPNGYSINMSGIDSYLIQNIGRFVENYNSDYLITREHVQREIITRKRTKDAHGLILFGLRRDGVDSNDFVCQRLMDENGYEYRKLYAMEYMIHCDTIYSAPELEIRLYDITHHYNLMQKECLKENHNNGRGNTVVALYTIVYNDMKTTTVSTH